MLGYLWKGGMRDAGMLCACSLKNESKFCACFKAGACLVGCIYLKCCSPTLRFTALSAA